VTAASFATFLVRFEPASEAETTRVPGPGLEAAVAGAAS
jgi:hypothetical protein